MSLSERMSSEAQIVIHADEDNNATFSVVGEEGIAKDIARDMVRLMLETQGDRAEAIGVRN